MVSMKTICVYFNVDVIFSQVKFIDVCDLQIANRNHGNKVGRNVSDSTERDGRESPVIGDGSKGGEDGLMLSC
jgi:hypothetical protein